MSASYLGESTVTGAAVINLIGTGLNTVADVYSAKQNRTVAEINADMQKAVLDSTATGNGSKNSMSDNTKLAIGIGGAAVVGLVAILALK